MNKISKEYLGYKAREKLLGLEGVITSISQDLFGCVMVDLHTGLQEDGKPKESRGWYDIARIEIIGDRVMEPIEPRIFENSKNYPNPGPSDKKVSSIK